KRLRHRCGHVMRVIPGRCVHVMEAHPLFRRIVVGTFVIAIPAVALCLYTAISGFRGETVLPAYLRWQPLSGINAYFVQKGSTARALKNLDGPQRWVRIQAAAVLVNQGIRN